MCGVFYGDRVDTRPPQQKISQAWVDAPDCGPFQKAAPMRRSSRDSVPFWFLENKIYASAVSADEVPRRVHYINISNYLFLQQGIDTYQNFCLSVFRSSKVCIPIRVMSKYYQILRLVRSSSARKFCCVSKPASTSSFPKTVPSIWIYRG